MGSGRCRVRFRARADCRCFIVKTEGKLGLVGRSGWFGDRFRTVFGQCLDNFRIIFGLFSDSFRIVFGSFSDRCRIMFGPFFGPFSDHFGTCLGWPRD